MMSDNGAAHDPSSIQPTDADPSTIDVEVGESLPVRHEGDVRIETTRSEEHLFTTIYSDADSGEVRLALQVDITTGQTAIDPRRLDRDFWTLVAEGTAYPDADLKGVLRKVMASSSPDTSPSIEVEPEAQEIHVYVEA